MASAVPNALALVLPQEMKSGRPEQDYLACDS